MQLFITCSSGLEPLLEEELISLGYAKVNVGFRGVYVEIDSPKDIYKINYCSRIATRVLFPLLQSRIKGRDELYQAVSSIDWKPYFKKNKTLSIDANVDDPAIRNSLFAAQVVKDAICDQLVEKTGKRPSVDNEEPDVRFNLFLRHGRGILSLDTSGDPLHKRGYRQEGGEAPLGESLACALLKMANYTESEILIDPMVGSGTLLIEAALIASRTPPGIYRKKWGFQNLIQYSEEEWLRVKIEEDGKRVPLQKGHFFGIEINKNGFRIANSNLKAAGFSHDISIEQGDFRDYTPHIPPTLLITNPPYGRRLGEEEALAPLYRSLGDFMKRNMAKPSRGFVLTGSPLLAKEIGLAAKRRHVVNNGGIESRFLEFDLY